MGHSAEDRLYPISLDEIPAWRERYKVSADEARKRFAQFVILECLASTPALARQIVFKGGNAPPFFHQSRRSTIDLDFSAMVSFPDDQDEIRQQLDNVMRRFAHRFRVSQSVSEFAASHRIRRRPFRPMTLASDTRFLGTAFIRTFSTPPGFRPRLWRLRSASTMSFARARNVVCRPLGVRYGFPRLRILSRKSCVLFFSRRFATARGRKMSLTSRRWRGGIRVFSTWPRSRVIWSRKHGATDRCWQEPVR